MLRDFIRIISFVIICPVFYYCSFNDNPVQSESADSKLLIQTSRDIYIHDDWVNISGTLINTTKDTFYSTLGDAFNTSNDQEYLYFAEGSDAYLQHHDFASGEWQNRPRGLLAEGTKEISLSPEKEYTFSFYSRIDSSRTGYFRFLVQYYRKSMSPLSADTLQDTSNTFIISGLL